MLGDLDTSIVWIYYIFENNFGIKLNPSNAEATFFLKHNDSKIFEDHLSPVMLVFIR